MITAAVPVTTFQVASWSLKRRRIPTFDQVASRLQNMNFTARCAIILAELNPARFKEMRGDIHYLSEYCKELVTAALGEICEIAPLDMEFIENGLLGDQEEILYLYPEPYGFPIGWDEWEEMGGDPSDCDDQMGMYIFWTALRLDESETLGNASEHFGWDLPDVDLSEYGDVDWKRLYKLLDKAGLGCFKRAIDVCMYTTGNPYYDFNPYDEEITNLPPFSIEGVRELQAQYQDVGPIQVDYRMAKDLFENDPDIPRKLLKLWLRCSKKRERVRTSEPQRTLAEIWGEIEEINGQIDQNVADLQRIIDPFYGPLDGRGDPDENEDSEEGEA